MLQLFAAGSGRAHALHTGQRADLTANHQIRHDRYFIKFMTPGVCALAHKVLLFPAPFSAASRGRIRSDMQDSEKQNGHGRNYRQFTGPYSKQSRN
jgi:hypothetical protein